MKCQGSKVRSSIVALQLWVHQAPLRGCPPPVLYACLGKLLTFNWRFGQLPVQLKQLCWILLYFLQVRISSFYIIWVTKYQKEKTKKKVFKNMVAGYKRSLHAVYITVHTQSVDEGVCMIFMASHKLTLPQPLFEVYLPYLLLLILSRS